MPPTMSGCEGRLIAIDVQAAASANWSHQSQGVVDDSRDWRNRVFRWHAIVNPSAQAIFPWDRSGTPSRARDRGHRRIRDGRLAGLRVRPVVRSRRRYRVRSSAGRHRGRGCAGHASEREPPGTDLHRALRRSEHGSPQGLHQRRPGRALLLLARGQRAVPERVGRRPARDWRARGSRGEGLCVGGTAPREARRNPDAPAAHWSCPPTTERTRHDRIRNISSIGTARRSTWSSSSRSRS